MKFGLFYELNLPRPWGPDAEETKIREAIEQIELADRLGYDCVWAVEHHFLEEYAHSSAPEVLLAALSQRTTNIRLGHGIVAALPGYNHPARIAERIGMLDLISGGRVEFGTGETSSDMELMGFGINRAEKRAMWEESVSAITRMFVEEPFKGIEGRYVTMPARNVVPKPKQKPHPPMWVACSRKATITMAAQKGLGALAFAFLDKEDAQEWVEEYYSTLERDGVPIGFDVNPNLAMVTGFMCCPDEQEALDKGLDGAHFFAYSLSHYYVHGTHRPNKTSIWDEFLANRESMGMSRSIIKAKGEQLSARVRADRSEIEKLAADKATLDEGGIESLRGAIGTPDQLRTFLRGYDEAGVDQMIFVAQAGHTKHEHICASLELFARDVMPEFTEREEKRQRDKAQRLAPVIDKVMARRPADTRPDPDVEIAAAAVM